MSNYRVHFSSCDESGGCDVTKSGITPNGQFHTWNICLSKAEALDLYEQMTSLKSLFKVDPCAVCGKPSTQGVLTTGFHVHEWSYYCDEHTPPDVIYWNPGETNEQS